MSFANSGVRLGLSEGTPRVASAVNEVFTVMLDDVHILSPNVGTPIAAVFGGGLNVNDCSLPPPAFGAIFAARVVEEVVQDETDGACLREVIRIAGVCWPEPTGGEELRGEDALCPLSCWSP